MSAGPSRSLAELPTAEAPKRRPRKPPTKVRRTKPEVVCPITLFQADQPPSPGAPRAYSPRAGEGLSLCVMVLLAAAIGGNLGVIGYALWVRWLVP